MAVRRPELAARATAATVPCRSLRRTLAQCRPRSQQAASRYSNQGRANTMVGHIDVGQRERRTLDRGEPTAPHPRLAPELQNCRFDFDRRGKSELHFAALRRPVKSTQSKALRSMMQTISLQKPSRCRSLRLTRLSRCGSRNSPGWSKESGTWEQGPTTVAYPDHGVRM